MGIADRIYEIVKRLPDSTAAEVLDFAEAKRVTANAKGTSREAALEVLARHAGKFKVVKFNRADLYDRAGLR